MDDRRALIAKILQYQDRDSLLRLSVVLCEHELQAEGCSLFLFDAERSRIVLKESTVLTRFLGQSQLIDPIPERAVAGEVVGLCQETGLDVGKLGHTMTLERAQSARPEAVAALYHFGLTRWTFWTGLPLIAEDVREDIRWSSFEREGFEPPPRPTRFRSGLPWPDIKSMPGIGHCELPHDRIGSLAVINVGGDDGETPAAVLRVVRSKDKPPFDEKDLAWMTWFADLLGRSMKVAISLSDLTDLGTRLEIEDFGRTLIALLQTVLRPKGCSIFLEIEPPASHQRVFHCIATTGLLKDGQRIDQNASYEVDLDSVETEHLTSWVLRNGQLIALTDVHSFDPGDFPGLRRQPGSGKYSETDASGVECESGPLLISPLFLYQSTKVAGAIRVSRPRGEAFETPEQLLFLDISKRLSRVLTNLHLRQASEKLIKLYNKPDKMLDRVPEEVCRLLGAEGCSVLLREGNQLVLKATGGALKGQEGRIRYNLDQPENLGWTGWVAAKKRSLLLNAPAEADQVDPLDPPVHVAGEDERPCETGEHAFRFLGVPIFRDPEDSASEVLGVVRVPRREMDPAFEEVHQSILVSFAARLSLALNLAERNEQLEAIVHLSDVGNAIEDPKALAGRIVEQAVDVLIDTLGFDFGAVYTLDTRTGAIRLRHGRSGRTDFAIEALHKVSCSIDGDNVHARAIHERKSQVITGWEAGDGSLVQGPDLNRLVCPILFGGNALGTVEVAVPATESITVREENMVRLLGGSCANALYNEAVFQKLDGLRQGLVKVGTEMTVDSPLKSKLAVIADVAAQVTQADNVIIHEYLGPSPEPGGPRGRFRESACFGPNPPKFEREDLRGDAVPFRIVESKVPIFAEIAEQNDVIFHKKALPNFIQREGIRSVAALPLRVGETCVGCIFFNFSAQQEFDAQKRQEIQMMAEYAAVAIYQGRLLEETTTLAKEKSNLLLYAEHSLNQPLNALLSFLWDLFETSEGELQDQADQMYRLCKYLSYLVRTFLQIDRLETSRRARGRELIIQELFQIERSPNGDLSTVCRNAAKIAEAYLLGTITQDVQAGVKGHFDENAMQISLLNVLVNAVKHGRPADREGPGDIRLSLTTSWQEGREWAEICVEDSGPGVPAGERGLIFGKGYRLGRGPGGLGIGLFLTHGYTQAHGGIIRVEDSDLGGARFAIRLPLSH